MTDLAGRLSPTLKKYFFNTSWLTIEKLIRILLSFLVSAYVARYLGPEKFGRISYVMAFVLPFTPLMTIVLDNILVKAFHEKIYSFGEIFKASLFLRLIGTGISLLAIFLWTHVVFVENQLIKNLMIIYAVASSFKILNVIEFKWQAEVKAKYIAIVQFLSIFLSSLAKLLAIFGDFSLTGFIYAYGIEFISLGLIYFAIIYKEKLSFDWSIPLNKDLTKKIFKEAIPLIFAHILIYLNMRVDQLILKELMGVKALGQYSIAAKLSEVIYFIPMVIQASIYPFLLDKYRANKNEYLHFLKTVIFSLFWGHSLIGLITIFVGKPFIHLVFGPEYRLAYQALVIHIFSGALVSIHVMLSQKYVIEERNDKCLWGNFGAMSANIIANFILIPRLGIQGAAISVLIGSAMSFLSVGLFLDRSVLKISLLSPIYLGWTRHLRRK